MAASDRDFVAVIANERRGSLVVVVVVIAYERRGSLCSNIAISAGRKLPPRESVSVHL